MRTTQPTRSSEPRTTTAQDYLDALARRLSRSDDAYRIINPLDTFQQGACWVFAQAAHEVIPGSALLAVSSERNLVEHVVVYAHGVCLDSDGCASPEATLRKWEEEGVPRPLLRPFNPEEAGEVVCPRHMVDQLKPLIEPIAAKLPEIPKGICIILLDTVGNPDFGQDGSRRLPGTRPEIAMVGRLEDAPKAVQAYVQRYNLGAGNCPDFQIIQDGVHIAEISYNGRIVPIAAASTLATPPPTRLRQAATKAPGIAQEAPGIAVEVYDRLRAELDRWSQALASGDPDDAYGDSFHYEMFARRLEAAKEGSPDAARWAEEWHAVLASEDATLAASKAEAAAKGRLEAEKARAELEAGRSGNPIFQAYLDTVEDPKTIENNVEFFIFVSHLKGAYEKSLKGLSRSQREALPEGHFAAFRQAFSEVRWSDRVRQERMKDFEAQVQALGAVFRWHLQAPATACIDEIREPETITDHGRSLYLAWEKALPRSVERVEVLAQHPRFAHSLPTNTWEALGFRFSFDGISNHHDERTWRMSKGVNGHPTPAPTRADEI